MTPERVVIAEIVRPRGNRGEVLLRSLSDVPGRFENLKSVWVRFANGSDAELKVESVRNILGNWVLKFEGVSRISEADRFRGAELWVRFSERGQLPDQGFFYSDLVGSEVIEAETGKRIGRLEGWQEYGGPPLMAVAVEGREVLIPFVNTIYRDVDLTSKRITVQLPDGLLDL